MSENEGCVAPACANHAHAISPAFALMVGVVGLTDGEDVRRLGRLADPDGPHEVLLNDELLGRDDQQRVRDLAGPRLQSYRKRVSERSTRALAHDPFSSFKNELGLTLHGGIRGDDVAEVEATVGRRRQRQAPAQRVAGHDRPAGIDPLPKVRVHGRQGGLDDGLAAGDLLEGRDDLLTLGQPQGDLLVAEGRVVLWLFR